MSNEAYNSYQLFAVKDISLICTVIYKPVNNLDEYSVRCVIDVLWTRDVSFISVLKTVFVVIKTG